MIPRRCAVGLADQDRVEVPPEVDVLPTKEPDTRGRGRFKSPEALQLGMQMLSDKASFARVPQDLFVAVTDDAVPRGRHMVQHVDGRRRDLVEVPGVFLLYSCSFA